MAAGTWNVWDKVQELLLMEMDLLSYSREFFLPGPALLIPPHF